MVISAKKKRNKREYSSISDGQLDTMLKNISEEPNSCEFDGIKKQNYEQK